MDFIGGACVTALFLIYLALWGVKRRQLLKTTGVDADVMGKTANPLQRFMRVFSLALTLYMIVLIPLHFLGIRVYGLFARWAPLDKTVFDLAGLALGLAGLSLCLYAQVKMGKSWRVGIDEKSPTQLVTDGLYRFIRNPTYVGLFTLLAGVWMIWPTFTVFLFCVLFTLFLEIQVRCEEDFLQKTHGETYLNYKSKTKRYLPFIY